MALVKPVVFQIVGYRNSGKTSFVTQLITSLKAEGLRAVSIKHHGHGGKPSVDGNKDSTRHLHAGAAAALVEGEGLLLLQAEKQTWTLDEKIKLLRFFKPDVIIIEGYKRESFPKLVLVRERADKELLTICSNVKAVVYWEKGQKELSARDGETVYFHICDHNAVNWVIGYIKNQLNEENS